MAILSNRSQFCRLLLRFLASQFTANEPPLSCLVLGRRQNLVQDMVNGAWNCHQKTLCATAWTSIWRLATAFCPCSSYENTEPVEDTQRRLVFWIAYILDKDVAARTRQAPIYCHMALDLPLVEDEVAMAVAAEIADAGADDGADDGFDAPGDGACARGMPKLNLFRARAELAQIQGRVYDCVFSVQARYMDLGEKARLAPGTRLSIQQWKARVPSTLDVDFLSRQNDNGGGAVAPNLPAVMFYIHFLTTMYLRQLCAASSIELDLIEEVLSYAWGLDDSKTPTSFTSPSPFIPPSPPSHQGWNVLVGSVP